MLVSIQLNRPPPLLWAKGGVALCELAHMEVDGFTFFRGTVYHSTVLQHKFCAGILSAEIPSEGYVCGCPGSLPGNAWSRPGYQEGGACVSGLTGHQPHPKIFGLYTNSPKKSRCFVRQNAFFRLTYWIFFAIIVKAMYLLNYYGG